MKHAVTISVATTSTKKVTVELEFPIYRKYQCSQSASSENTYDCIDADGNVSTIAHFKQGEQRETFTFSRRRIILSDCQSDYIQGLGGWLSTKEEFEKVMTAAEFFLDLFRGEDNGSSTPQGGVDSDT